MSDRDQELRAIAYLAARCRPIGCKQWDETGIFSNLKKVADRSLGSIAIAAIQAAEDRNAVTPGVIPTTGPHWRAPDAAAPRPVKVTAAERCGECSKPRLTCEATPKLGNPDLDHDFVPDFKNPPGCAVDELRDIKAKATAREPAATTTTDRVTPGAGRQRLEEAAHE